MKAIHLFIVILLFSSMNSFSQCIDSLNISSSNLMICQGNTVNITTTVFGNSPFDSLVFNWSTGDTTNTISAQPGSSSFFHCTVTSLSCLGDTLSDTIFIIVNELPIAMAGSDQLSCSNASISLNGSIGGGASSATWSGGSGTFTPNANTLNADYTPSASEISSGSVILTLTTNNPIGPCNAANDQIVITINPAATVDAGNDQTICSNSTVTLAGIIGGGATSATWSGGSGTFTPNANTLNADYTPSATDISSGSAILTLTTNNPIGPCNATNDQVVITINPVATVDAGNDQTICSNSTASIAGSIGGGATSATWSGGDGTFTPNANTLNADYTPSATEISSGSAILTLTTNNPIGPCNATNDQVVITINPVATVDAGNDQTICSNSTVTLAGSIGGGATSATWSGGSGTITPNANTLNAVYTPSETEISVGSVILILTTDDPSGPCIAVSDQVNISINNSPTSNAGIDQVACIGSQVLLSGEIGGVATTATWEGGNGTFIPDNSDLNALYQPSPEEVEAGFVVLTLTTNDPDGPCTVAENQMTITISPDLGNTIGPISDVCQNSSWNLYENNCEQCYIAWEVVGGEIQGYASSNAVYVKWDNTSPNSYLVLEITNPLTGCSANDTLLPTFATNFAPLTQEVMLIDPNFNLLGLNQNSYSIYTWGYSLKYEYTAFDIVSTGNPYASFPTIDTLNYDYWVEYGDINQCLTRSYYNKPGFLGIDDILKNTISVYPNPFLENIIFNNVTEETQVRIFDSFGSIVLQTEISPSSKMIHTDHLKDGMYFVNVEKKNKSSINFKLIKK